MSAVSHGTKVEGCIDCDYFNNFHHFVGSVLSGLTLIPAVGKVFLHRLTGVFGERFDASF